MSFRYNWILITNLNRIPWVYAESGAQRMAGMLGLAKSYLDQSIRRAREGGLPVWRQLGEMLVLELFYSVGPGFYHKAKFWCRDTPFREKTRYRVGRRYIKSVAKINNHNYYKLSQHKLSEKALLTLFKIPTAEFLGYLHPASGQSRDGSPLTNGNELAGLMQRLYPSSAAIKMPEGSCGVGFDIIDLDAGDHKQIYSRALKRTLPVDEYVHIKTAEFRGQGILVETAIVQHSLMSRLNATSVNTLRLWVRRTTQGNVVKSGLLKIGDSGKLTDYTATGGLVVPLDIRTGVLGKPAFRPPDAIASAVDYFDSDKLEGFGIPFWNDVLSLASQCLNVFPEHNFAGMDIAITEGGPLVVEINVVPDPGHAARVGIPTMDLLSGETG